MVPNASGGLQGGLDIEPAVSYSLVKEKCPGKIKNNKKFDPFESELINYIVDNNSAVALCLYHNDSTWYEWKKEMMGLFLRFTDVVFKVNRNGEEHGDLSDTYFKNGKFVTYVAEIPPLNEADFDDY